MTKKPDQKPKPDTDPAEDHSWDATRFAVIGLFVLALVFTVYHAKPILLPVILAVLMTLVLKPVQRFVTRWKVPSILAAVLVIFSALGLAGTAIYQLQRPAAEWMQTVNPNLVKFRVQRFFAPLQEFRAELAEAAKQVEELAETEPDSANPNEVDGSKAEASKEPVAVEVVNRPMTHVIDYAQSFTLHVISTLLLTLLFLAFGDSFHRNLAAAIGNGHILQRIGASVSRYLFTITVINVGLGICIGIAMAILRVPNPVLWGSMAALFNFIPYLGALGGTVIVFFVAVATFSEPLQIALPPLVYFGITSIEGNLVTPTILGRRFTMNPIIIFLWLAIWSILWGAAGILIAMPLLMAGRIVCREVPQLNRLYRLLDG